MAVTYEWDVEAVAAGDTADHEDGECIEHRHQTSYADCLALAATTPPAGCRWLIVLVRDDDDRRAWAYLADGKLPESFTDADGDDYRSVPKRFHAEVERAARAVAPVRAACDVTEPSVTLRISPAIEGEYENRLPDHLPLDKLKAGKCTVTLTEARAVLSDAEFNSDTKAFDVGPYGMPLGTFNAYRALAKQARKAIADALAIGVAS